MTDVALELREVSVRFGGVVALRDVSLTVAVAEIVGLIGPNGAGKTTLLDAVTGFTRYDGSVLVAGRNIDRLRPHQRAASGVGRTFQSLELFEDLSVRENVSVGAARSAGSVDEVLEAANLAAVADRLPGALPPSTRRLVALARASAARPRVLLLDEIAAGLDRDERSVVSARVREIVSAGVSVLLVDHDLGLVADLCGRVVVLDAGRVVATGAAADIRRDERVLAAYLGSHR